jgi:hypothetical protein
LININDADNRPAPSIEMTGLCLLKVRVTRKNVIDTGDNAPGGETSLLDRPCAGVTDGHHAVKNIRPSMTDWHLSISDVVTARSENTAKTFFHRQVLARHYQKQLLEAGYNWSHNVYIGIQPRTVGVTRIARQGKQSLIVDAGDVTVFQR